MKIKYLLSIVTIIATLQWSAAQEWQEVSSVPDDFRTDHSFGFAIEGTGYLVTGARFTGEFTKNFYSYDPISDEWTRKEDFPGAARGFAIGEVYEGKAYFGFGADNNSNRLGDLWEYDPETDQWTELATCECLARIHPAMNIVDGKIYVGMGGTTLGNMNDWWEYDIATNNWAQKADFPAAPRHHPFQFVADGVVYAGFGHGDNFISNQWYKYDHNTNEWSEVATLPGEGRVAGTQFSHGGMGYVLSGDGSDHQSMEEGEFWQYDPNLDIWTQMPSHPGLSRWAPASFVLNDEVYLINGYSTGIGYPSSVWKFPLDGGMVSTADNKYSNMKIYPNPASFSLQIDGVDGLANDAPVLIYNTNGQLVYNKNLEAGRLDVSEVPSGLYYIEAHTIGGEKIRSSFTKN